jgi:hypothetical protein
MWASESAANGAHSSVQFSYTCSGDGALQRQLKQEPWCRMQVQRHQEVERGLLRCRGLP